MFLCLTWWSLHTLCNVSFTSNVADWAYSCDVAMAQAYSGLPTLPIFAEASRFWGTYYDCTIWQCKLPIFHTYMLNSSGEAHCLRFAVTRPTSLLARRCRAAAATADPHVLTSEAWRCYKRSLGRWSPWESTINTSSVHAWLRVRQLLQRLITARPPRL